MGFKLYGQLCSVLCPENSSDSSRPVKLKKYPVALGGQRDG